MSSGEEKLAEQDEQQQHSVGGATKRKLAAQASFDDDLDLDGFSELDTAAEAAEQSAGSVPNNGGAAFQNGTTVSSSAATTTTAAPQPQQQQQSVLQELLLTQSTASAMHNNSPRPSSAYTAGSSGGTFPTKSPMAPSHQMAHHGTPMAPQQNMSPMGMMGPGAVASVGPARATAAQLSQHQQIRQQQMAAAAAAAAAGHHGGGAVGFDPSTMVSQGGGAGTYLSQQQQQFGMYHQHARPAPSMYGTSTVNTASSSARLLPGAQQQQQTPSNGLRQPVGSFSGGGGGGPSTNSSKGIKQQAQHHPGMMMMGGGNAPTPPASRPMMIGQPGPMGAAQPPPSFDSSVAHSYHHQQQQQQPGQSSSAMLPHAMNGPLSSQRDSNNGFMMAGPGAHHPMQSTYMGTQQQRMPSSTFGQPPSGAQQQQAQQSMLHGSMDASAHHHHQQQQQQQQSGGGGSAMLVNGQQQPMVAATAQQPSQRQSMAVPTSSNQIGGVGAGGMLVAQSPLGMLNAQQQSMNSNGPQQLRGVVQQQNQQQQQQMLASGGGGGQPQDPEKRKLIQQQLVLLLHAHKCQQRERSELPQNRAPCTLPYCTVMKGVLEHMVGCTAGRQCQYAHCASSRQIISHWKNCSKDDCPVCNPVKRYTNGTAADRRQGDIMLSAASFPTVLPQQTLQGAIGQQQPSSSASVGGPSSVGMCGGGASASSSIGGGPLSSFGSPPSASSAVNNLLDGYTPNTNPFLSINPPNRVGQSPHQMGVGNGQQLQMGVGGPVGFGSAGEGMPPPEPPNQPRDWHASITPDLRNHLVGKLVKAIFPYPDPAAVRDQRIRDLLCYARKVEKDMFEAANDKEAYYHMLAEKIYKIQKELQEKKNRRLGEAQLLAHQQQQLRSSGDQQQLAMLEDSASVHSLNSMSMPMSASAVHQQQFGTPQPFGSVSREVKQEPREQQQPPMLNFVDAAAAGVPPSKRIKMEESHPQQAMGGGGTCSTLRSTSGSDAGTESVGGIKQENISGGTTTAGPSAPLSSSSAGGLFPPTTAECRRSTTPKDVKPSTSSASSVVQQEPIVRDPKVFDANELRQHLLPVWHRLMQSEPAVIPFRFPVDPKELNIPDYFDIVKHPMDLQTIRANLDQGKYKNPLEFCDHMWLMFENAWLYNRKNTKIHKWCTQLSELFVEEINPVMRRMGYCCGQKLSFTPLVQFCFGITKNNAACVIARDQPYLMYESSSTGFGVTVAERYIYCVKCFEALPDEGINLNENTPEPPNWIPKTMFQKMKNDQIDMEPFEQCQSCERKWHRICALHSNKIHPGGFVCDQCRAEKGRSRPDNRFTAKKLPHYNLSRHIEDRVNNFLRRKLTESDPEVEVIIRVLCSADKEVEVKPAMLKKYASEGYPDRFPYRSKTVFAFELVKDPDTGASHEVCFFGLYVQEYGTNCQPPNQRRVYIAYLDSVHFFQPRTLRTAVYYEIMLGYLDYAKSLGYTMAHIWACPPSEGDDYIFHCHPQEQKIPKPKRLQDWYKTMLNNGQAKDDGLDTPMKLPYFEGDYWPRIIDECIVSAEKEEEQDRRMKLQQDENSTTAGGSVASAVAAATLSDDDTFQTDDGFPVAKQKQQQNQQQKNNKKKAGFTTGNPVVDKLFQQLDKHRDVFFTIRLFSAQEEQRVLAEKPRIEDPDPLVVCELMDTRDNFLAKSREEHWEFSQMRRAKWSTLNFCYTLHTQEQEGVKGVNYTCNVCEKPACFHCNQCEDYDLCDQCRAKSNHPHEMEKLILGDDQKLADSASSAASRNDSVKKCISSLVHACTCRDANCRRGTCHKMKRVIQHTKTCKRRQSIGSNCAVCKQLIALCCYHAKHCTQTKCQVPFCLQIRAKLQEQKRSQNRQAERMMQRRMMKLQSVGAMNGGGGGSSSQMAPSVPTTSSSSVSSVSMQQQQQSPWAQPQSPRQQQQIGGQFGAPQMQMSGMMMSPNAMPQQQRLNGPMGGPVTAAAAAAYHQMQNPMSGAHQQMINSPPMSQYQTMGGPSSVIGPGGVGHHQQLQQQHPSAAAAGGYSMVGAVNHHLQQSGGQQLMGSVGLHRVPSSGALQQHQQHLQQQMMSPNSQQHITPPPYVRSAGAAQQSPLHHHQQQQQPPFSGATPQGMNPLQPQVRGASQQPQQGAQPKQQQQQQRIFQQQQMRVMGHQVMNNSDVQLLMNRFKEASQRGQDDVEAFFVELRKTPHLLNAFLKLTKKQGVSLSSELLVHQQQGGSAVQQHFIQPAPTSIPPSSSYYQQQPSPAMVQQQQQNGGAGIQQFGTFQQQLAPHGTAGGQWMPPGQAQQQSAPQRNSS
uniref:histone acetyltransferase n=1 Tax=Globodera rostochiensis TaxID=31243 RepID=A0A914I5F8_GLORO